MVRTIESLSIPAKPLLRAAILLLIGTTLGLLLSACGDSELRSERKQAPRMFELMIEDGRVAASNEVIRVVEGERVRLRWLANSEISIHLHGYDIEALLAPDLPTEWNFIANVTGRFPVEVHDSGASGHAAHDHHHSDSSDHPAHMAPSERHAGNLLYFEVHPR